MNGSDRSDVVHVPDEGDRAFHMGVRVARTARESGSGDWEAALLRRLHRAAMEPRRAALAHQRDPLFLHPGRSALVLLLDAGVTDVVTLGAALTVDSERPDMEPSEGTLRETAESAVSGASGPSGASGASGKAGVADVAALLDGLIELRDAVPRPDAPELAEALVVGPEALRLVALAERLDHLRHAHLYPHLWDDEERARSTLTVARDVYLPVAERTHPVLLRRYGWWCRTFARELVKKWGEPG